MRPRGATNPNQGDVYLGRYRVVAELARGGMAAVFLAVGDLGKGPEAVAIKQIHTHLAFDPEFVAMLMDEARLVSLLKHPAVVEVLDYKLGEAGTDNFIVMEYVAGEALSLVMKHAQSQGIRVGYALAASVAADVAGALHCAHELRGPTGELLEIVHRDVTPQNILVGWDGAVKLTDFGIAKAVGRLQRTQPGEIKGKIAYMAPEHAFGKAVDRRSDVYSLGVVLYELCLNRRLFGGKTDAETIRNVMQGVITPPREVDPDFPVGLEEIVMAMLAADPAQRFQSAGAVERALRAFVQASGETDVEARRGALVRELDPGRYQGKYELLTREVAKGLGANPPPQVTTRPSVKPPAAQPKVSASIPPQKESSLMATMQGATGPKDVPDDLKATFRVMPKVSEAIRQKESHPPIAGDEMMQTLQVDRRQVRAMTQPAPAVGAGQPWGEDRTMMAAPPRAPEPASPPTYDATVQAQSPLSMQPPSPAYAPYSMSGTSMPQPPVPVMAPVPAPPRSRKGVLIAVIAIGLVIIIASVLAVLSRVL